MDTAAASEGGLAPAGRTQTLAALPAGGTQTLAMLGPCLSTGMGEAAMVERMNSWGAARDQELLDLRSNLATTQVVVSTTFDQAKETLLSIVVNFRAEAETLRQHGQYEATQSVARLEHVIAEARTRFDAQDVRFTENLGELARRQQAVEAWARAEPTRVAAIVQAAPTPPWVPTSPGGTPLSFYPSPRAAVAPAWAPVWDASPGMPAAPTTPEPRAAVAPAWAPAWDASPSPQAPGATPAWDAWAAGRGAAPGLDAWAAGRRPGRAGAARSPARLRHGPSRRRRRQRRQRRRIPLPEGDAHRRPLLGRHPQARHWHVVRGLPGVEGPRYDVPFAGTS